MKLEELPKIVRDTVSAVGNYLNENHVGQLDRVMLMQQGIAKYLGCELELPSAEVARPLLYFRDNHGQLVDQAVSEFNETYPLDVALVKDLAYKVWYLRYRMAFKSHDLIWKKYCNVESNNLVPSQMKCFDGDDQHVDVISNSIRKRFK